MSASHPCQPSEAFLLGVIKAVVERFFRIGEMLQRGGHAAQMIGIAAQALDRTKRRLIAPIRDMLDMELDEVAKRRLKSWPVLFLIWRELKRLFSPR